MAAGNKMVQEYKVMAKVSIQQLTDAAIKELRDYLFSQAKQCQTANGAAILLAIKSHLFDNGQTVANCDELWQIADVMGRTEMLDAKDAEIDRLKAELAALKY